MIKVLVVEDSPVVKELLVYILNSDPRIQVIGTAGDGEEAIEFINKKKPDIITMDIHMPKMDGIEATRKIMETIPVPIIIVSGSSTIHEVVTTFRAMEAGALAIVSRPVGIGHPDHEKMTEELVQTVKLMSEIKLVRRRVFARPKERATPIPPQVEVKLERTPEEIKLVAIGASTGGPLVIQKILAGLPKDFSVPVLIVQHIAQGFARGFIEWLTQSTGSPVHLATHGELLLPGHTYVAPDEFHMGVNSSNLIVLSNDKPENGLRPSVSYLFRSVAATFGGKAIGVLLTGMGRDGAEELKLMKDKGCITIVQDRESSVVYGMPGEAMKLEAAMYVLPQEGIVAAITSLVSRI